MTGRVFNIQRFSIHDGPGIRTTVFVNGCPADCWWCHNPEARSSDPAHWDDRSVEDLMTELDRDAVFYEQSGGGITFSGGEPLDQPEFLAAGLRACRERGYSTAVDTCGAASEPTILGIAELTDLFLYDLKLMDDERHRRYVGLSNQAIVRNLEALAQAGAEVWIRIPVIPGVNDDLENLSAVARFVRSLGRPYPVYLLPYHLIGADKYRRLGQPYRLEGLREPNETVMGDIAARFREHDLDVRIGA